MFVLTHRGCLAESLHHSAPNISNKHVPNHDIAVIKAGTAGNGWTLMLKLQALACPLRRAAKALIGSSLSCGICCSWTRATLCFLGELRGSSIIFKNGVLVTGGQGDEVLVRSLHSSSPQYFKS
ncbi:hypothetical protein PoB_000264300 [Plakobranchus ocellatus]|uniref:Uncharacterized protein n=1 Tax=Plakobranchus ocellatus TaxID=259542 RepID=A0AAV3Y1B0_9GAST|nr:hypothetical protein PoB_000264300 [Plakobranchus ocellatus]